MTRKDWIARLEALAVTLKGGGARAALTPDDYEEIARLLSEGELDRSALALIDAVRNDIVGRQRLSWSAHIYPLVSALNEAGFVGEGYEVARERIKEGRPLACFDCGLHYSQFALDVILPRPQWLAIFQEEHGVLCALCIVRRASHVPGATVVHAFIEVAPHREVKAV